MDAIEAEYPEAMMCYVDTDSIHVAGIKALNKDGPFYQNYIKDNVLGNFKIEDSCGCELPEAVYVTNKVYALRNPNDHTKEKIKSKGVPQWLCNDDEKNINKDRREQYNLEKMSFQDMIDLVNGKPFKFTISQ